MAGYQLGSSPPARGTLDLVRTASFLDGLIPACAGNTHSRPPSPPRAPAHPRLRGEHMYPNAGARFAPGSSPPARGTLGVDDLLLDGGGLIPACAGNTHRLDVARRRRWAHPRLRGEHKLGAEAGALATGSSPPARGTLFLLGFGRPGLGLIPACAGNTAMEPEASRGWWAHPRLRGEHRHVVLRYPEPAGSSPPARGTLIYPCPRHDPCGLIPACAGNTKAVSRRARPATAHPRLRGEHSGGGA